MRKVCACSGDAHGPSAPENAQLVAATRYFNYLSVGQ